MLISLLNSDFQYINKMDELFHFFFSFFWLHCLACDILVP